MDRILMYLVLLTLMIAAGEVLYLSVARVAGLH